MKHCYPPLVRCSTNQKHFCEVEFMVKVWSTKCGLEQIKVRPKRSWWHNFISSTVTALIDLTYEGEGTHKSCKNSPFVWPCSSFFFFQVTTSTHPLGLNNFETPENVWNSTARNHRIHLSLAPMDADPNATLCVPRPLFLTFLDPLVFSTSSWH